MQQTDINTTCYHCGVECEDDRIEFDEKAFCCNGCKVVYEILSENQLCNYYDITKTPGVSQKSKHKTSTKFSILDQSEIKSKLVRFTNGTETHVSFFLPQVHCSSCIWLLENLNRINDGILNSRVDFALKEISIIFNEAKTNLQQIAELLASLGYEPHLNLNDIASKRANSVERGLIYKLGIAGFCFGNVMMLSFPEYFSDGTVDHQLKTIFNYLNLGLSLPVFFYSATVFYKSAWGGLKKSFLNIDAPIVLAILITFLRSVYEIVSGIGAGYLDSMCGIVFFMLIGRYLQDRTYRKLSFERDYRSYFPIAVTIKSSNNEEENVPITKLKVGNRIIIKNQEMIPADSILFTGEANIDYSFVTGESAPVRVTPGEIIYAGGKQVGSVLEMEVVKDVSNSYLTQLWNKDVFNDHEEKKQSYVHAISRYFTLVLFVLAAITAIYWAVNDSSRILNAVSAMLIIACPCALLLSSTFTNGNVLRIFSRNGLFLKNATVIETIAETNTIVLDKTGTITQTGAMKVNFTGAKLSESEKQLIRSLASQSAHPYSNAISDFLPKTKGTKVINLVEVPGYGLEAAIDSNVIRMGSATYLGVDIDQLSNAGKVYVSINEQIVGYFTITNTYREGVENLIDQLRDKYSLALLSGDNNAEKTYLSGIFADESVLNFNQTPESKLRFIKEYQMTGKKVMMLGDGLNDAGALKQSNTGIAISDEINNFSPACDAILAGNELQNLPTFIRYAKATKAIVMASFMISIAYNLIGLYFAMQGTLSPVIAAILMPSSSLTIILFTTGMSSLVARFWQMK
ncbi:heavy metal translocating P-type ATPase metal-binding domain-containing protein [Solitalea sp. MAHUQ-68]|uniref:Heavy metal translocating P-type ATPase metal-binding domain-containing protein n=1 Tax=Solitalea agri TaxID=2953739 RepID=A0A9X2JB38_9SPHI|nr:heavy metal translocating P-type ATPase metal-binding domain-containing protein [Solitalea agri]MCO4291623.1 heavy metal translocating P-type ATPase metal-binding domain-containing protein [Solitalea agri]